MKTNDKTLADVQPGGRVRLGDQAERARFEAYFNAFNLDKDADGSYLREMIQDKWEDWQVAWQAALSAQPSPGGQGDARSYVIAAYRKDGKHSIADAMEDGSYFPPYAQRAVNAVEAALAARQPVGESFHVNAVEPCGKILYVHPAGVKVGDTLYAAPPAQAVDLGQFREAVEERWGWAESQYKERGDTSMLEVIKDCDRLLALIDSQAVGK